MPSLRPHRSATENSRSPILRTRSNHPPLHIGQATDDKARLVLGWWHRMHRGRRPLIPVALKPVRWQPADSAPERCIWEVCKWPQRDGFVWHFVCWNIDGVGAWWKTFPSKRAAMTYFRQAPREVMARAQSRPVELSTNGVREGVRCAAAS
jgi:hypothetical protein